MSGECPTCMMLAVHELVNTLCGQLGPPILQGRPFTQAERSAAEETLFCLADLGSELKPKFCGYHAAQWGLLTLRSQLTHTALRYLRCESCSKPLLNGLVDDGTCDCGSHTWVSDPP